MTQTSTLALTPWASEALSLPETDALARRLVDLHARASVMQSRHGWTIRVESWAKDEHFDPIHRIAAHRQRGHLADLIDGCISEYASRFAYTPAELVTIAAQSGLAIERHWPVDHADGE